MTIDHYIKNLRITFGDNLEELTIDNRYSAIALLSLSINAQSYPYQMAAVYNVKKWFTQKEVGEIIYDCPVSVAPSLVKFFSESIPVQ